MRLYHFHAPLLDQHHGKQVFIANKARNIAKSLHGAVWKSFDFLETGLAASFLFAISPLTIFYGRAVLPDPWMLACMLICAAFYRRYLDDDSGYSWLAAALFGLLAAGFKYYGLMVPVPLRADQRAGRGGVGRRWLAVRPERDQPAARGTTLAYCCDPGCYRASSSRRG